MGRKQQKNVEKNNGECGKIMNNVDKQRKRSKPQEHIKKHNTKPKKKAKILNELAKRGVKLIWS